MRGGIVYAISAALIAALTLSAGAQTAGESIAVSAKWDNVSQVSETVPTTQHLANAFTLRSNPLNKKLLKDLRDLHTNDTRLQLWFSVPNQVVAELKEPTATETFWDFKYIDPVVIDFFKNTSGIRHINIGTIPRWMFNVPPVDIPTDPAASFYPYTEGTTGDLLKDPTGKQFADYQARIFAWYTQGGFTDELGKYHESGYHFKIDYWGVMNESTYENKLTVEQYTRLFDAVVEAIHKVDPRVEFFGPEVVGTQNILPWATYFLNPKNHSAGALPLKWFSLHNYVHAENYPTSWHAAYFTGDGYGTAKSFAEQLRELIKMRDQLSLETKIAIDELGTFDMVKPGDKGATPDEPYSDYDPLYWVASGANWADNFITAENLGVQLISMTQMVGAPTQSESCSMINWDTAQPNAHYWVLSLINSNFGLGDKLVRTQSSSVDVVAQASITPAGRKVLLVNTSDRKISVDLAGAFSEPSLKVETVDESSGENPPRTDRVTSHEVDLAPFATAVVSPGSK
jgi:hypothetical protein